IFPEAESPRSALRWHLSYMRGRLPDAIRAQLHVSSEEVAFDAPTDVAAFQFEAARLLEHPDARGAGEVLARYRGDLCAGLTVSASAMFDTWLYVQQEALRRTFRQATVAVARYRLATGEVGEIVEALAGLVVVDPYFEDGHMLLIEAA